MSFIFYLPLFQLGLQKLYVEGLQITYSDAVALPHGDPHGHRDGRDQAAKYFQQGETEALPIISGGYTGETWTAPESETT